MDSKINENTQIVENMDTWARNLAEKVIKKEMQHIPASVAALACVYFVQKLCDSKETILRRDTMAQILAGGKNEQICN